VALLDREDSIRWVISPSGQFSTSSLYKHCSFSGVVDVRMEELWSSKFPLKIRHFLWLVFRERI
jgi:S-adenosylmethionine:diacylglycerol 3-amino-3-carboxypropyl transferase